MNIHRSISCALLKEQVDVVFRDLCRLVNYYYPNGKVATKSNCELQCNFDFECPPNNLGLPMWIKSINLKFHGDEIVIYLNTDGNDVGLVYIENVLDNIKNKLTSLFKYETRSYPSKVFCIGWSKTGTASVTEALRILGLFSLHGAPWAIGCMSYDCNISSDVNINLTSLADYTSVSDIPVCMLFRELDKKFPNSKFILTIRSEKEWIKSVSSQLNNHFEKHGMIEATTRWAYGVDYIDEQLFLEKYIRHNEQVLDYFKGRSDLLVIDISEDNAWQKLCEFLNLPKPEISFPHLHKQASMG